MDLNHEVVRRYLVYAPVKLFRGACGSKFLTVSYTVVIHSVKLFRGACGSKFFTVIPNINNIWSSSFAELVDLNLCQVKHINNVCKSSSFAELVDLNPKNKHGRALKYVKLFRGACGSKSSSSTWIPPFSCQALSRSLWI